MKDFSTKLVKWYLQNRRDLPWRGTQNPYYIWISEIILQQTRVDQGLPYYERFIKEFPEIKDLATAHIDKILRLWQGLGYYSRARNLHSAAKQVVENFNGEFPDKYEAIRSLKGIGDYTAAAISSFAFNLPHPVVDGNVYRFLSRYFGLYTPIDSQTGKKDFAELATKLLNRKNPAIHNQAIMEFGALVCKPSNPLCNECPFASTCHAYNNGVINELPVKSKKQKTRTRYFNYLVVHDGKEVLIAERKGKDIWQGLYEFPLVETESEMLPKKLFHTSLYIKVVPPGAVIEKMSSPVKHLLSHQVLLTRFCWIRVKKFPAKNKLAPYRTVPFDDLDHFGMPRLIVKYLESAGRKTDNTQIETLVPKIKIRKQSKKKTRQPYLSNN